MMEKDPYTNQRETELTKAARDMIAESRKESKKEAENLEKNYPYLAEEATKRKNNGKANAAGA